MMHSKYFFSLPSYPLHKCQAICGNGRSTMMMLGWLEVDRVREIECCQGEWRKNGENGVFFLVYENGFERLNKGENRRHSCGIKVYVIWWSGLGERVRWEGWVPHIIGFISLFNGILRLQFLPTKLPNLKMYSTKKLYFMKKRNNERKKRVNIHAPSKSAMFIKNERNLLSS